MLVNLHHQDRLMVPTVELGSSLTVSAKMCPCFVIFLLMARLLKCYFLLSNVQPTFSCWFPIMMFALLNAGSSFGEDARVEETL